MKRLLTTILSVAAVAICLSAATPQRKAISMSTGQEISMQDIVPTSCVIDTTADGVTVSYHIENILLEPDSLYAGSYKCIISDFVNSDIEGAPAYPLRRDFIELPFGCSTPTLTITKASFRDIPCEMAPAYPFYIGGKLPVFTREHVLPINPCSFGSQSDIAVIDEITSYLSNPYACLTINPCQYNSTDKVIRIYTDFEYRINYGPVDKEKVIRRETALTKLNSASQAAMIKAKLGPIDSLAKPILPIDTTHYCSVIDDNDGPVYNYFLIITADKYLEAVDEFAAFKRKFGFRTHVSSRVTWTPAQIQDTINSYNRDVVVAQQACEKNFHVLLIGGHADVPAMETEATVLNSETMRETTYNYITDYYYSCLNGSKSKGVELGRLPVNSIDELQSVIGKIKNYIMAPSEDESFYHTGVHIAYYDGISGEWHPHIYGSETCRGTVLGIRPDIDVKRLYLAQGNADPRYYGANQSKANVLPIELQRPNYSWDTDKYDIAEELENGCFYTLYRGHGGDTTYVDPYVTSSDIKNGIFKNHNKLPVFLNFTCLTGNFKKPGCIAESLLTNPYGGGIGVFAATASTNCEANNTLSKTMLQNWMSDSKFESFSNYDHYAGLWGSELGRIYDRTFIWNQELAN